MKEIGGNIIDKYAIGSRVYTTHDLVDERAMKANVGQDELKIGPVGLVKSFREVYFEDDAFEVLEFDGMETFLSCTYGFMNLSVIQKGELFFGYMLGKDRFDTICDDFGYDFVKIVI